MFQCRLLACGERPGLVDDAPGQRRNRDLCSGDERPAERECKPYRSCHGHRHRLAATWASPQGLVGAGPKSTLGGLETSFSFSTVKLGFDLYPNIIAVRLEGKGRTVTLYPCTALM